MPRISYTNFDGEIPKWSADLLPNDNAQLAQNCIFSNGKLRSMRGGALLQSMVNNPVKGIYTDDGLLFYTWQQETLAFKSPIIEDNFDRVYYLTPSEGIFRVTTTAEMTVNGPSPTTTFKVGVPQPTIAPVLRTQDRTTLPDYPSAVFSADAWWDYNGTKYSETAVALTPVVALRSFTFSIPALPASPPSGVTPVLVLRLKITDAANANAVLVDASIRSTASSRSSAFPGTMEMSISVSSAGAGRVDLTWGAEEARAYTYTYENDWNEEGAPAPPAVISCSYVQDVVITATSGVFTGYRPFSNYNIYRTYGTSSTYVRTAVAGTGPFTDSSRTPGSVGTALLSTDWLPPVSGLGGIALMPGGWFVTFKENILYKHEPYRPHAVAYTESFAKNIRGICVGRSGLVVTTADGSYLVPGAAPSQSGYVPLGSQQPGVSQRSMQSIDGAVFYASNDGIPMVNGSISTMDASEKLFTREKWRELYSSILLDNSMRFAYHDGMLLVTSSTHPIGFMLRLDENAGSFTRIVQQMDATFQLPITDALYYSVGANVYQFNAGAELAYDWWSRDFVFTYETTIGAGYLETTAPVQLQVYVDDVLCQTKTVGSGFFRLKSRRGRKWSFRLGGTSSVKSLKIAQSMQELKDVR